MSAAVSAKAGSGAGVIEAPSQTCGGGLLFHGDNFGVVENVTIKSTEGLPGGYGNWERTNSRDGGSLGSTKPPRLHQKVNSHGSNDSGSITSFQIQSQQSRLRLCKISAAQNVSIDFLKVTSSN
jgi:hypothetical protein